MLARQYPSQRILKHDIAGPAKEDDAEHGEEELFVIC
jgi:hypothetical protein